MNFFLLKEYLLYLHLKTDEHSILSPFFYHFFLNNIKDRSNSKNWEIIEKQRKKLLKDKSEIKIFDLGAGSKVEKSQYRQLKSIAKHSLSSPKFSQFLFRLIQNFKFTTIIELGTSLGINTAYLATANSDISLATFEADPAAVDIAKEVNKEHQNIQFHLGDIADLLPDFLDKSKPKIDLVYADANHTYEASIEYFNMLLPYLQKDSIYIMDDIHWSAGMRKAWEELKNRKVVRSSIDLFDAGLLFFNPDFKQQHYILDF